MRCKAFDIIFVFPTIAEDVGIQKSKLNLRRIKYLAQGREPGIKPGSLGINAVPVAYRTKV